jgi:hypothetical protein
MTGLAIQIAQGRNDGGMRRAIELIGGPSVLVHISS